MLASTIFPRFWREQQRIVTLYQITRPNECNFRPKLIRNISNHSPESLGYYSLIQCCAQTRILKHDSTAVIRLSWVPHRQWGKYSTIKWLWNESIAYTLNSWNINIHSEKDLWIPFTIFWALANHDLRLSWGANQRRQIVFENLWCVHYSEIYMDVSYVSESKYLPRELISWANVLHHCRWHGWIMTGES